MKHLKDFINESILSSTHSGKTGIIQTFLDNNYFVFRNNFTVKDNEVVSKNNSEFELHLDCISDSIPDYVVFGKLKNCVVYVNLSQWNTLTDEQKPKEVEELHISCDDTILKPFNTKIYDLLVLDGDPIDKLTKIENFTVNFIKSGNDMICFNCLNQIDKSELNNISIKNPWTIEVKNCKFFDTVIEITKTIGANNPIHHGAPDFTHAFKKIFPSLAKGTQIVRIESANYNSKFVRKGNAFVYKREF